MASIKRSELGSSGSPSSSPPAPKKSRTDAGSLISLFPNDQARERWPELATRLILPGRPFDFVSFNLPGLLMHFMREAIRKEYNPPKSLPFGRCLTLIFQHFDVPLDNEPCTHDIVKIDAVSMHRSQKVSKTAAPPPPATSVSDPFNYSHYLASGIHTLSIQNRTLYTEMRQNFLDTRHAISHIITTLQSSTPPAPNLQGLTLTHAFHDPSLVGPRWYDNDPTEGLVEIIPPPPPPPAQASSSRDRGKTPAVDDEDKEDEDESGSEDENGDNDSSDDGADYTSARYLP